jgi:nanoRNase/pAp phosphatase (c-di-AMP/oligoRNAs hydrolase)
MLLSRHSLSEHEDTVWQQVQTLWGTLWYSPSLVKSSTLGMLADTNALSSPRSTSHFENTLYHILYMHSRTDNVLEAVIQYKPKVAEVVGG